MGLYQEKMDPINTDIFDIGDKYTDGYLPGDIDSSELLVAEDSSSSFLAEFHNGYIFRMLIEYLKETNTEGNFVITKHGITYTQSDGSERLLNDVVIHAHELVKFEFYSQTGKIIIGVNLDNMKKRSKSIKKKSSVVIYKEPGQNFLCMQINGQGGTSSSGNIIVLNQTYVSPTIIDLPEYNRAEDEPNCVIAAAIFLERCAFIKDAGVSKASISGYNEGMVMLGRADDGSISQISDFGILPEKTESDDHSLKKIVDSVSSMSLISSKVTPLFVIHEDIPVASEALHTVTVDVSTINALAKLNNITPGGVIRWYIERNKPIKLVCHIGTCGQLSIILKGIDNPEL